MTNQVEIVLTLHMLKLLVEGQAIGLALPDLDLVVFLRCEASVAKTFSDSVNSSLLHLLPGPSEIH